MAMDPVSWQSKCREKSLNWRAEWQQNGVGTRRNLLEHPQNGYGSDGAAQKWSSKSYSWMLPDFQLQLILITLYYIHNCYSNKIAQSNSETSPARHKLPINYNGALHIRPQNYPLPLPNSQTQLPASSLDASDLPSQTASISDQPFCHNALDRQTDRPTDGWRECSMTVGRLGHSLQTPVKLNLARY